MSRKVEKSKDELLAELKALRLRIRELEAAEEQRDRLGKVLAESQRTFTTLVSNLPGMVYRCRNDRSWTMEMVSPGCLSLTGYEPSDLIGNTILSYSDLIHPSDREHVWTEIQKALGEKRSFQINYRIITAKGEEKCVWEQGCGVFSSEDELIALEGYIADITDFRHTEEDLRHSERKFRSLFENSADGILLIHEDRLLDCNPAAVEMMRCSSKDELLSLHLSDLSPERQPDGRLSVEKEAELLTEAYSSGSLRFRWIHRRATGELFPAEVLLTAIPLDYRQILYVVLRDITETVKAEEALRESEQNYRILVESSSDAIVLVSVERRILSFNRAFLDLFGFTREEVEGNSMRIVHPSEESFLEFGRLAYPVIQGIGPLRTEWKLRRKDGRIFPIEGTYSAIKAPDGSITGYVAIIRDISKRKRADEELERHRHHLEEIVRERTAELLKAQKALVQKEKLKTLGAISAEVAHEIRNPLMSIGGFARRLQKKMPDLPEVNIIISESHRLEAILNRIKNYLKPVEMRPEECSVNSVVTETMQLLSPDLDQELIEWELHLDPDLHTAYVDPGILAQVFINIVRGVVQGMEHRESLMIRTFESDQNIHIEIRTPLFEARIEESDNVLLAFTGTGQSSGLPLCFRLLKDMGGVLSLAQEQESLVITVTLLKAILGRDPLKDSDPLE